MAPATLLAALIIGLTALQRLAELAIARGNERRLRARGGVEIGRGHYPLIVALHAGWLIAIAAGLPAEPAVSPGWLACYLLLQVCRVWVIWSLGPYWTTRIITVPGAPLVRRGPYRWLRHPNYWVVALEIPTLPLVFGETWIAITFTTLNAAMLAWRIRVEDAALAARR